MNFHRSFKIALPALVVALIASSAGSALATDRDLAYLHALESRGFGDVAVNYLETLDKKDQVSPAVRDVFDLEMSKGLRAEAQNPPDPAQRGALLSQSQKFLDQFVKNNPNHAEALQAQITSAEMMFDHAQETISGIRLVKEKTEKTTALTQARGELAQVKAVLQPAVDKLAAQLKALGPRPTKIVKGVIVLKDLTHKEKEQQDKREELQFDLIRTQGELALVDYFTAQTYTEPTDEEKKKVALNMAYKSLDAYYQQHRGDDPLSQLGRSGFIGALVAHTWSGKASEEIGNKSLAKDLYDEVLESFPELPEKGQIVKVEANGSEPALARAKYYSLQLIASDPKQEKQYLAQAEEFLTTPIYKKLFRGEWGYQATSLDVAKRLLATAEKETDAKLKSSMLKEALDILKDMASVRSEFQDEATQLRLAVSRGANPTNVDEAIEFIRLAYKDKDWGKVEALCQSALELLKKSNKKDAEIKSLQGSIQDWLAESQIQPMLEKFNKEREPFNQDKYVAWAAEGLKAAQDNKKSVIAPKAASFAVYCAAVLYGKARSDEQGARTPSEKAAATKEKAEASKRLQEVADFLLTSFPNSSEADEARLSLAKAKWSDGNVAEAITAFESINPKSEKYPEALKLIGELKVEQFEAELRKPAKEQDPALVEKYRVAAVKALTGSVDQLISALKPGDPIPEELIKTQLLLAQVHMQVKEYAEAVKVLQPLIAAANAAAGKSPLNETMLKIFSAAVKAYMAMDDFKNAGEVGNKLIDLGPDIRSVNVVLVDFVRRLDIELKDLRDKLDKLADAAPAETESLRARVSSIKGMMSTMVGKLAKRTELDANMMVYLGSLFTDIDDFEGAKAQYQKVQELPEANEKLKMWVGAQLVDILGKEGSLEKATDEIAKLREKKPNNLDFMIVEAKLWQEWGQKDVSKYDTAIQKWTDIRKRLQRQKLSQGGVYYDAVYNAAFCCLMEANKFALNPGKKADAIHKAEDGEKVLKSELIPNPNLNGPPTVKRFKDLLSDLNKTLQKLRPPGVAMMPAAAG